MEERASADGRPGPTAHFPASPAAVSSPPSDLLLGRPSRLRVLAADPFSAHLPAHISIPLPVSRAGVLFPPAATPALPDAGSYRSGLPAARATSAGRIRPHASVCHGERIVFPTPYVGG